MTRISNGTEFGVYILTYPGDFHLSTVLVLSIQKVSPDVPIMIIPGEGFDREDHPFHVPIMPEPAGCFWPQLGHQDRIHLVLRLAKRRLLCTHHGALRQKHPPAYPDEFVFRNRRTATSISPSFTRLIQHAIQLQPTANRALVSS